MKFIPTLLLLLIGYTMHGQASKCECADIFQDLIDAVEENYSLYTFKVSDSKKNKHLYNVLKSTLIKQSLESKENTSCTKIIDTYISFFNDGHIWARILTPEKKNDKVHETIEVDTALVLQDLKRDLPKLEPIVGVWEDDGNYRMLIMEETDPTKDRNYVGIILSSAHPTWSLGQVKMNIVQSDEGQYDITYYMGNFSPIKTSASVEDDLILNIKTLSEWRKTYPLLPGQKPIPFEEVDVLEFKDYGKKNYYIKLPSFNSSLAAGVQKFVDTYHEKLIDANALIIDLRDNSGGNDDTYAPLLPYIYTGPVRLPSVGFWVSDYNKEMFNSWFPEEKEMEAAIASGEVDDVTKYFYEKLAETKDEFLFYGKEDYSDHTIDTLYRHPKHIALITNDKTASSGETFVYRCNQADRVITFGQETAGVVDGFNGNDYIHPCFTLRYPTSIRTRNIKEDAIDPHGIYPDVYLDKDQEDIVAFIVEFLNNIDENSK